jgi:Raf kinase inhibitor-like YbhB/YbcL family protein
MRRWLVAALPLALSVATFVTACSSAAVAPPAPTSTLVAPAPTPSGPTPTLPVARAIPSPSAVAAGTTQAGFGGQPFVLQSSAFADGGALPPEYTCDGGSQAPPLAWSGAPPATAAYALIEEDADSSSASASGPYVQWLVYNMPISVNQLAAGTPPRPLLSNGAQQGMNSNQMLGYLGACPNAGDPPHHFSFMLFALDGFVTLETGASYESVHDALMGHTVGQTQLTATFKR